MKKTLVTSMEVSPAKLVAEELDLLRKAVKTLAGRYLARLDAELGDLRQRALAGGAGPKLHDLRDMLIVMRGLRLEPEAGRRKDLKKIETAIEELQLLAQKR